MKRMSVVFVFLSCCLLFSSCLKEEGTDQPMYVSYGMVENDYPNAVILTDEGTSLQIVPESMPTGLRDGMRVLVNYLKITEYSETSYLARLVEIRELLLKSPIDWTNPSTPDNYGDDPVGEIQMAISERYLNIMVTYSYSMVDNHTFNLLLKQYDAQSNTLYYEFRHKSQDLAYLYTGNEVISFDLSGAVPSNKTSVNVEIRWMGSGDQPRTKTGVYDYIPAP